ncbi:MAG: peptide deformylase [Paracoccaceae bacterium]
MTVRPCLPWPDKRLRTPANPVDEITDEIRQIWDDMIDTMEAMPGVGLAAPQIGVMLRLAVVDGSTERGRAVRLANPEVIEASSEMRAHDEASPNLPGVSARLERPRVVTVRYLDENGMINRREFRDLESTSVQHQIDHLNGRMYFDRLSKVKRDMLVRKARKKG